MKDKQNNIILDKWWEKLIYYYGGFCIFWSLLAIICLLIDTFLL